MLDLQSGLKDKDKQQVCNNISTSVGILQNNHDNNSVVAETFIEIGQHFGINNKELHCQDK